MANLKHLDDAINIMQRVKQRGSKVFMARYQFNPLSSDLERPDNEAEVHACGSSACFAGWVAVSQEWRDFGGAMNEAGAPYLLNGAYHTVAVTMSTWLGLPERTAHSLIYGDLNRDKAHDPDCHSDFYGKRWGDVNADDVLLALHNIREDAVKRVH